MYYAVTRNSLILMNTFIQRCSVKHGFIGFGNLAKAVYRGLEEEKGMQFGYFARSRKEIPIPFHERMEELVEFADVIWLMVKPQDLEGILTQLRQHDTRGKTIVSPVAGKPIAYIERFLGKEQRVVRIMPNLAIAYRESVTAVATNRPGCSEAMDPLTCWGRWVSGLAGRVGSTFSPPSSVAARLYTGIFRPLKRRCKSLTSPVHYWTNCY